MQFNKLPLEGLVEIIPRKFEDERGFFFEAYHIEKFNEGGLEVKFVQDNQSYSQKGVLRGFHLQLAPYGQGKLVRCLSGKILDVALDLRTNSKTYGKCEAIELSADKNNMLYIPDGFGHAFFALEASHVLYKCTSIYHKESESGVKWNDKDVAFNWPATSPIVSKKDLLLPTLEEFKANV